MDKLPINNTPKAENRTSGTAQNSSGSKSIIGNAGTLVSAFIILVVIVVMLADIHLTDFNAWLKLGTNFFVLLFCNYAMYINQLDSGIKAGKLDDGFINVRKKYDELKKKIVDSSIDYRMNDFCIWYIGEELKSARSSVLAASGVSYSTYEPFIATDEADVMKAENLSEQQKAAIIEANGIKPISLNADMIMQRESSKKRRTKPRATPTQKRNVKSGFKLGKLFINSALISAVAFEVLLNPSFATIAATAFKVLFVVLNGFAGYRDGFENITVDTVDYKNNQIDLMEQFIKWAERVPVEEVKKEVA
ncbi:MAG: hypothetical protein IKB51_06865 [Clostridia bacterium]|nr:hypothetical protein [Clostridia bacterium]